MSLFTPIELNMSFTRQIYEGDSDNIWIKTAQKIAIYTVIPVIIVASFEAVFKNLILINTTNLLLSGINFIYDTFFGDKKLP